MTLVLVIVEAATAFPETVGLVVAVGLQDVTRLDKNLRAMSLPGTGTTSYE